MARPFLGLIALGLVVLAGPVLAQAEAPGQSWQDRSSWDWGQHRTGFAEEAHEMPVMPAPIWDHWDYPGAPVRFAGQPQQG
jgi:hypothetical protein